MPDAPEKRATCGGTLYVVATPIGHMQDLSARALDVLREADAIACEDTRTTGNLLARLDIHKPLLAYHEHNEERQTQALLDRLASGQALAMVSDAGTPAISDPGFRLVRACRRAGLPVTPIPGACAAIAVLSASGLPSHAFFFAGFAPPKSGGRRRLFASHREGEYSLIVYESCHRMVRCLEDLVAELGPDRTVCVAREVTKWHETFHCGPIASVLARVQEEKVKGEFVLIVAPEGFAL